MQRRSRRRGIIKCHFLWNRLGDYFFTENICIMPFQKILIIRFSSIGDIVLTTPVIRSIKKALPQCEIHYVTKIAFRDLLVPNPYVSKIHTLEKGDFWQLIKTLRAEKFDYVLDLHHNLRTFWFKTLLQVPSSSYNKKNLEKFAMVFLGQKQQNLGHTVTRYGETLTGLGISLDKEGLDYFLPKGLAEEVTLNAEKEGFTHLSEAIAVVLGAKFMTKKWLPEYFVSLLNQLQKPVVLIGGKEDISEAQFIANQLTIPFYNAVGKTNLLASAALIQQANCVIAHDTGFMHISAALQKKIFVIWGSTAPVLGFTPYQTEYYNLEVKDLACRPCTKMGRNACPKGHFNCMKELSPEMAFTVISEQLSNG
ncbi:MAG: glycosyltransferase family 9 protein [Bacteroidia bacterium]